MPKGISYTGAAGVPLCSLTAWQALVNKERLKKVLKVLIVGASGGVGSFAVQIATALGGEVTAVCSQANEVMVLGLSARKVINYHQQDFLEGNHHYDIIFDTIVRGGA
jgi:NADPH:quinone reductase-like Zn-dependent oxidoreductase